MREKCCRDCTHFIQHYGLGGNQLFRLRCGHCTHMMAKRKFPDTRACSEFQQGEPDEKGFATREYLSKALLEYMKSLDFLPEIEDV